MKTIFPSITRYIVIAVAGISLVSLLTPQPGLAQLNQVDNQPGNLDSRNANDPCAAISGQNLNVFSLIHCAQFKNTRWDAYQSNGTIDSAAAEFRKKQQEMWRKKQTQTTGESGLQLNTPNSTTNQIRR
jgi:hypothetical protein